VAMTGIKHHGDMADKICCNSFPFSFMACFWSILYMHYVHPNPTFNIFIF
jgi:hypothetical protein